MNRLENQKDQTGAGSTSSSLSSTRPTGMSQKSLILHEKKFILAVSLLSIVTVISIFNRNTLSTPASHLAASFETQNEVSTRQIASVSLGTTNSEDSLAKGLSHKSLDSHAQVGQDPSKVEQLTFGFLEGQYSVRLKNGKLNGLELSSNSQQPKFLPNLEKFISENKDLLPVHFESIYRTQNIQVNKENVQKFSLLGAARRQLAVVEFHLDHLGRLISMKVNNQL